MECLMLSGASGAKGLEAWNEGDEGREDASSFHVHPPTPPLSFSPPPPRARTRTHTPTTRVPIYTCSMGPIRPGHPCPRPGRWPSPSWGPRAGRSAGAEGLEARIEGAGRGGRLRPRGCPCVPGPKPQDRGCARGRPERSEASSAAPLRAAQTPPSARGRQQRPYPALPGPGAHPAPAPQQGTRICTGIWLSFPKGLPWP